jgi:hypothetical protein
MSFSSSYKILITGLILIVLTPGCASVQELAALRQVSFAIDGVDNAMLADVDLTNTRALSDINPRQLLDLSNAVRKKELPFRFQIHVGASNPEDNTVNARLVGLDWTLFIENRETVSGVIDRELVMPPGESLDIPIDIEMELFSFFESNLADMFELALNIAGLGGEPKDIRLSASPTIETPIGPIRYPGRIDIVRRRIGESN